MKRFKTFILGSLIILFILNFITAFSPKDIFGKEVYPKIFTNIRHSPLIRHDMKEIERMLAVLKELMIDPEDRFYVLASSYTFNQDVLGSAFMSFKNYKDVCVKVVMTHNVDKRDGFPQELLTANYVIVADPIQYMMDPKNQRVVGIPAQSILEQKNIGTSFKKLDYEFTLDGNIKVYIYKKIKPIQDADASALSDRLRQYYPDRENIYKIEKK